MSQGWDSWIDGQLSSLNTAGLRRNLKPVSQPQEPIINRHGKSLLNFSSNNYLGLANHPELIQAMDQGLSAGASCTSSRSIVGTTESAIALEQALADYHHQEAALIFPTGYMANVGVLSAFLSRHDVVFSDQFNHASIVDGIRLSQARHLRYRHNDLDHLERLLQKQHAKKRMWVVTDTVFSMDGDLAKLQELVWLKERYGFAFMVDEAHGGGVYGTQGQGVAQAQGLGKQIDLHLGTFSKAFGVFGAYVVAKKAWIDFLINRSRSFMYTTALPPVILAGIGESLRLVKQGDELRQALVEKSAYFRKCLQQMGFNTLDSASQIIPILIGEAQETIQFSQQLEQHEVLALPIRPPTVPKGTSRLRFSILANHQWEQLVQALEVIEQTGKEMGVI